MDEFELTRRVLKKPPDDPGAHERALARLEQAMGAPQQGSRRRPRLWMAVAASFIALLVGAFTAIQPFGRTSAAADELQDLGLLAGGAPGSVLSDGQFYLTRAEEFGSETQTSLVGGSALSMIVQRSVQTWISADGSGYRETSISSVRFSSPADEAAWEAAGRPSIPRPGEVITEHFAQAAAPWYDTNSLSTDAGQLQAQLRADPGIGSDQHLYERIGNLLAQGDATPPLRAALFEVASGIPRVQLIGGVTDPLGRSGTAIALDENGRRTQLIFDASTSDPLALEQFNLQSDGSVGSLVSWVASQPTQIVSTPPTTSRTSKG